MKDSASVAATGGQDEAALDAAAAFVGRDWKRAKYFDGAERFIDK
jgi:hypothetical protein